MVIKSITVKNFHKINLFKAHFKVGVNLVNDKNVNRISTAIDFLLRADKVCIPKDWVNENTYISARILTKEKKYFVEAMPDENMKLQLSVRDNDKDVTDEYKYLTAQYIEQDDVKNIGLTGHTLPLRLCWYKNPQEYGFGDLSENTNGIADTKFFRLYLANFIKEKCKKKENKYCASMTENGKFKMISGENEKTFLISCLLQLVEFWDKLEKTRNIHYENKPIILENLNSVTEINKISELCKNTDNQVIILSQSKK